MVKDVLYNDEDVQNNTLLCQSEQFFYIDFIFLLHWTIHGYFVKKEIALLVEPSIESWDATHLGPVRLVLKPAETVLLWEKNTVDSS